MDIKSKMPYVTILTHNSIEYVGILKIKSKQYISLYCINNMPPDEQKTLLEFAEQWWWQSNRGIPISLFMREEMESFEEYAIRFNTDSCSDIKGPLISLSDLPTKRIKRRNVALKKKK